MAAPHPLVDQILVALEESGLARAALSARAGVEALPEPRRGTAGARAAAAREQLDVLERTLLVPMRRELLALEALPGLAAELDLPRQVMAVFETAEGASRRIELTAESGRKPLAAFVRALEATLKQARRRVGRPGPQRLP